MDERHRASKMGEEEDESGRRWSVSFGVTVRTMMADEDKRELRCVTVSVSILSSNWIFTAIYVSPDLNTRLHFWENLSFFASSHAMPWLLAGNFNDVLGSYENLSYSPPNRNRMSMFNNLLNNCNLLDLSYNGPRFI
nr:hypothetical protein CFP56_54034 [Quercus suber]